MGARGSRAHTRRRRARPAPRGETRARWPRWRKAPAPRGTRPRAARRDARRTRPRSRTSRRTRANPDRPWGPPARSAGSPARPPACCGHGCCASSSRASRCAGSKRSSAITVSGSRLAGSAACRILGGPRRSRRAGKPSLAPVQARARPPEHSDVPKGISDPAAAQAVAATWRRDSVAPQPRR